MSRRAIEGENPLYLPQAKVYNGSCALGPGICAGRSGQSCARCRSAWPFHAAGADRFTGQASTADMKRDPADLAAYLGRELDFPSGAFLMTGTCIVPSSDFTLQPGDRVQVSVGELSLENEVTS